MSSSSAVLESYLTYLNTNNDGLNSLANKFNVKEFQEYNRKTNLGGDFQPTLDAYLPTILETDGSFVPHHIFIPYKTKQQKRELRWNLQVTNLLILAQKEYEKKHQKKENVKKFEEYSRRCVYLLGIMSHVNFIAQQINALSILQINRLQEEDELRTLKTRLAAYYHRLLTNEEYRQSSERTRCEAFIDHIQNKLTKIHPIPKLEWNPIKYLFLKWQELFPSTSKTLVGFMTAINEKRLYWVWGSTFIDLVIKSGLFSCHSDASNSVSFPAVGAGVVSWALYFLRLAFNFYNFAKHAYKHKKMSAEEKEITDWEKRSKWQQRKYPIKNDWYWGLANLFCFLWFNVMKLAETGVLSLFLVGDVLTVVLLAFDTKMAILDFKEQLTDYKKELNDYALKISQLKAKIQNYPHTPLHLEMLYTRLSLLQKQEKQCKEAWYFKNLHLVNNAAYAVGLFLAFTVYTFGGTSDILLISGTILCFLFTVLNNFFKKFIEYYKVRCSKKQVEEECLNKINLFLNTDNGLDPNQKKGLFLEIKDLMAEVDYQRKTLRNHSLSVTVSALAEACVVPVAIIFFPIGLGYLLIGFLAVASKITNQLLKPEKQGLQPFKEKAYINFSSEARTWKTNYETSKLGFFASSRINLNRCLNNYARTLAPTC